VISRKESKNLDKLVFNFFGDLCFKF